MRRPGIRSTISIVIIGSVIFLLILVIGTILSGFLATKDIEKAVESLIEQGGKTGYIIGADCSIHDELQEERIRWVVEASRNVF